MIAGLDSATPPTPAQARAAAAAGVRLWSGYISTKAGVGLDHPWTKADFDTVRVCGATPIAYCSGWDDPTILKGKAAGWNVRLCLDVEDGIRGAGPWVQGFLDTSGAGLYGNQAVHSAYHAPFRILYGTYFNANGSVHDPGATWRGPAPAEPHGYQWWNSHSEFGVTVDRNYFDDWFQGDDMALAPDEKKVLLAVALRLGVDANGNVGANNLDQIHSATVDDPKGANSVLYTLLQDLTATVKGLPSSTAGTSSSTDLTEVLKELKAISTHLGVGTP